MNGDWSCGGLPECLPDEMADCFYAPDSYKEANGGWEDMLRRLAKKCGCCVYVKTSTEKMDACGREMPGPTEAVTYTVGLGCVFGGGVAFPTGIKPDGEDHLKDGEMYVLEKKYGNGNTATRNGITLESACMRYLLANAGEALGILDSKPSGGGYFEIVFSPVAEIPEFDSLAELKLKLDVISP